MKGINIGLLHYVILLAIALFITVSLSSYSMTGNVVLNGKDLIIDKLKGLHVPIYVSLKLDTSKVDKGQVDGNFKQEITCDFRFD